MEYYQFLFESLSEDKKDILTALLNDIGFTGFEEEENLLKAFIKKDDLNETYFENVISITSVEYSKSIIQEINWNEIWESGFEPVTILHPETAKPFVYLRAGFHQADTRAKYEIVITPKMSFGTGHHATTYMMVEQMGKINFKGKTVIDFGTGTGVLAILAEKLGAAKITAIDNDDWSINNSKENIITNDCKRITLVKADTISTTEKASVILANINLNIITASLFNIKNACEAGATMLFSGILNQDEQIILTALKKENIKIKDIIYKNGWMAILTNRE
jgi:ribosomal protein L11 methyltransferase